MVNTFLIKHDFSFPLLFFKSGIFFYQKIWKCEINLLYLDMKRIINVNDILYLVTRTFKADGWFSKVVENMNVDEILKNYNSDKMLKDTNGNYHLVNEIKDAELIEENVS